MRREEGFTLIELMVTIAVLAIVMAIATPSFSNIILSNRIDSTAQELYGAIQLARSEAVKRKGPVHVCRSNATMDACANGTDWSDGWLILPENDGALKVWQEVQGTAVTGPDGGVTFFGSGMTSAEEELAVTAPDCANNQKKNHYDSPGGVVDSEEGDVRMSCRDAQQGATLIEVLVTILVLAIGLLGLAGLQVTSVQSNHSAYYRSQATILAYDISDRMRSNRTAALDGAYDVDFPDSSNAHSVSGDRATQDSAEWLNSLADTLPSGTGKIERSNNLITIHVRWDDNRGQINKVDDAESASFETFIYRTEI